MQIGSFLTLHLSNKLGKFKIDPLNPGFGVTIGNSFRRVLLSYIRGYAITEVIFSNVIHEYTTIPGIVEDVTDIILNIKKIIIKKKEKKINLNCSKKKNEEIFNNNNIFSEKFNVVIEEHVSLVTAGYLDRFIKNFEVVNKDFVFLTKNRNFVFKMSMKITSGVGYVQVDNNISNVSKKNVFLIDAIYSPIINVKYFVDISELIYKIDFESLVIEISTNGAVNPLNALFEASDILVEHFIVFSNKRVICKEDILEKNRKNKEKKIKKIREILNNKLYNSEGLSIRTLNCLNSVNLYTWKDVVKFNKFELINIKNFGKKSLDELLNKMEKLGICLGMDISEYI